MAKQQTTKKRPTAKKRTTRKKATTKADAKPKKLSVTDAAAKVLGETGKPMGCAAITEQMLAKGYWQTKGETPAQTLYSAILREMQRKGAESRFKRATEKGQFELAK